MINNEDKWTWIGELNELAYEMPIQKLIKVVEYARRFVYEEVKR